MSCQHFYASLPGFNEFPGIAELDLADGADGGYAQAAKACKQRLAAL